MTLLYCSKKYGLERLKESCLKFLNTNLSYDNVCIILQHAIQFDEIDLENRCLTFVMKNAEMVLKSDGLSTISKEVFEKVIESDELIADELFVYNACKKWAIAQCNGKSDKHERSEIEERGKLGDLIYSVRFDTMSLQTFAENVANEDILTPEEKVFVFQTIAGIHSKKTPFPFQAIPRRQCKTEVVELKRFSTDQYGTGWGYSTSPDVLNFKVSIPCKIVGVSLYAPCLADILEGTISLQNGTSVLTSEENIKIKYGVSKYYENVLFNQPVDIDPNRTYTISVLLRGVSSYHGIDGQEKVVSGQLEVVFLENDYNGNGTTKNRGQINSLTFEIKQQL